MNVSKESIKMCMSVSLNIILILNKIFFTNRCLDHIPITINNQKVPYANTAKYFDMTLDAKLRWKANEKETRGTGPKI
jgi:hypothetical protein